MRAKLTSLQILRAVAASMVVFYHFALEGSRYGSGRSWIVSSGAGRLGEAGVDLFFVLSGFIMFYTAWRMEGMTAAAVFLRKRAVRIYPLYWFWTTVLFVFWKQHWALTSHTYSNEFLVKSYLLIPAFSGENLHPFLNQGWTLTYELLFYLVFAAAMVVESRRQRVPIVLTYVAIVYSGGLLFPQSSTARQVLANPLIFEFVLGVVAGAMCMKVNGALRDKKRHLVARLCLGAGVVALIASVGRAEIEEQRLLFYGVPGFLVVLGAALWKERTYHRYLVFLGDASYSIYLIHGMGTMMFATLLKRGSVSQRLPLDVMIVGGTILLAPLCAFGYLLVERPLLRALSRLRGRRKGFVSDDENVRIAVG